MSEHPPTPLAHQVAIMAAEMRAAADHQAAEAGLIAVLHALILATLARLLDRLETMVALWAAGALPARAPRQPSPAHPRTQAESHVPRTAPRRTSRARPHQAQRQSAPVPEALFPAARPAQHPPGLRTPHACPRHAPAASLTHPRARPSPAFLQKPAKPNAPTHAYFITISKLTHPPQNG